MSDEGEELCDCVRNDNNDVGVSAVLAVNLPLLMINNISVDNEWTSFHYNTTSLHNAAEHGHETTCLILLEHGVQSNCADIYNTTPLHKAAKNDHTNICSLLLEHGANVNHMNRYHRTPLHLAVINSKESTCNILLKNGAQVDSVDEENRSPLHWAAMNGNDNISLLLLQAGANVHSKDSYQRTPLHWAATYGHESICSLLIQHGAIVDSMNKWNMTCLHMAAFHGHGSLCLLLLQHESNFHIVDRDGNTPLAKTVNHWSRKYYRCGALMVLKWVQCHSNITNLTEQQLLNACQAEVALAIHRLSLKDCKRIMEWVGMLECSKVNIASGMFQVCPLPFQEMVVAWLKTVSAEWGSEVDGARVRVSAWVGHLPVELVERVVASMASKYMTFLSNM